MPFQRGDKVFVYADDMLQRGRDAVIISYGGRDAQRKCIYLIEFDYGWRSMVREEWIEPRLEPMMPDAADYLKALNDLA